MENQQICLALDLKDDPNLIAEYDRYHQVGNVWPEVLQSLHQVGIKDLQIYRTGNRLFMIMKVDETFDMEVKAKQDADNPKVQEWEQLMSTFQQMLPWAKPGQKWVPMHEIFKLSDHST